MSSVIVSIVCTNYNKGDWIETAIKSFLAQKTNFNYEIILIDDKSTDHSPEIIKKYAKKYPGKIRAFYNEENLGITKTWIKICKEARGKYIARCDGDDYWVDELKLQKQVDLLEKSKDSEWCSTDYSIVDKDGVVVHEGVFESGVISRPGTYAEMIATKGFTAPSSWVVGTKLLQEVNSMIDMAAVDDTFNIQLELFNKTKLSYIADVTVFYRENEGSDSRPTDDKKARARDEGLLKTQIEYLEKFKNIDYEDIIRASFRQGIINDERLRFIHHLRKAMEEQERIIREKDRSIQQLSRDVEELDQHINDLRDSKKYKIGGLVTAPASIIRSILRGDKSK